MNKDGSISINQTFHGYDNGHSLIASSVELSSDVKRKMLPISDMSGNSILDGFEEYVTAYPLKEMNFFAIAKTWYASEMERPGCVWTHTLLFSSADIPLLNDVSEIFNLFKRPGGLDDADEYKNPLTIHPEPRAVSFNQDWQNNFPPALVKKIIQHLYSNNDKSILIRAGNTTHYDKLLLSLWLQQWPRLKRIFNFCSGAIEPRMLDKRYLDIQIVPYRAFRESSSFSIIDGLKLTDLSNELKEKWVNLIYEDLKSPSLLRGFIATYGADVLANRISFKHLADCFLFFDDAKQTLEESITFVGSRFSSPTDAFNLKSSLLEPAKKDQLYFIPKFKESEILYFLATTHSHSSLDYTKLKFEERFLDYFIQSPNKAGKLLNKILESEPNKYGEDIFRLLSLEIEKLSTSDLLFDISNLLSVFISLNPRLTYSANFWRHHTSDMMEIIQTLQRADDGNTDWSIVISLLLDIQASIDPTIFEQYETRVAGIILDWINQNNDVPLDDIWTTYLQNRPEDVLSWLLKTTSPSPVSSSLVINFLNPNSKVVISKGSDPWLPTIEAAYQKENNWLRLQLSAFCLALAFNLSGTDAIKLFKFSFETVYNILAKNQLPFRYWSFIEVHTKPLSIFKDWDKCKKIVNALVEHSMENGYDLHMIISSIESDQIKERILKRYAKVR